MAKTVQWSGHVAVKSRLRVMATSRWLRWAGTRAICLTAPQIGRTLSFPTTGIAAIDAATEMIESGEERLTLNLAPRQLAEAYRDILAPAKENDRGDTSTYQEGYTPLRTEFCVATDCLIMGHTLAVLRARDLALIGPAAATPGHNLAKPFRGRDRQAGPERHVVLTCNGNYFHFFSNDIVPLLRLLRLHGDKSGSIVVVASERFPAFVFDTLAALSRAFPQLSVLRLARDERVVGAEVLFHYRLSETGWMPVSREEADSVGAILLAGRTDVSPPASPRIFVSRGRARLRRLNNERALVQALAGHGFSVFEPDARDQLAQVQAFGGAREIVSVHGAALTNLIFCRPGAKVIELFPSNRIKSAYFWLANSMGLEYSAVIGSRGDFREGFSVEVARVLSEIGQS